MSATELGIEGFQAGGRDGGEGRKRVIGVHRNYQKIEKG